MGCVIHEDAPLEWRAPSKDSVDRRRRPEPLEIVGRQKISAGQQMAEIVAGRSQLVADQERHIGDGIDRGAGVGARDRYDAPLIVSAGHTLIAVQYLEALGR